jgi:hypothetical protein
MKYGRIAGGRRACDPAIGTNYPFVHSGRDMISVHDVATPTRGRN